jgi:hypothetical protein
MQEGEVEEEVSEEEGYGEMNFRERYRETLEELDRRFREQFEMSMQEFWERTTPKINPVKDDPIFNWHKGETDETDT